MELDKIFLGDNRDVMKTMPDNSVDSVVTDPPYGISFMNKKWDYDVPSVETWREVLRVLKPGGHALVACGTRTQHRMAVNLEDAGFEIRDIVAWVYGNGFPKNHNIAKDIAAKLTPEAAEPYAELGTALKPAMELWTLCRKPLKGTIADNVLEHGTGGLNIGACRVGVEEVSVHDAPAGTFAGGEQGRGSDTDSYRNHIGRWPANVIHDGSPEVVKLFPETGAAKPHAGDGKPLDTQNSGWGFTRQPCELEDNGGSAARFFYTAKASTAERNDGLYGFDEISTGELQGGREEGSAGSVMKDENGERINPFAGAGAVKKNIHPTVKPVDLMRYLCRLITPRGAIVLDPFIGSGTTAIAAKQEKIHYIGIEIDPDYHAIAVARTKAAVVQYDIFDVMNEVQ